MEENQRFIERWLKEVRDYFLAHKINKKKATFAFLIAFFLALSLSLLFSAPKKFPVGTILKVNSGQSLQTITLDLHEKNIIRSKLFFRSLVILFGGEKRVIAGDYLLEKREGTFSLARRLVNGKFQIDTIKITIPEGWNAFQIADYLEKNLLLFDKETFLDLAKPKEGYLFPDTYFVSRSVTPVEIIKMLEDNFEKRVESISQSFRNSTKSEKQIIIMASILEGEALPKDRNVVAGILWKRLEMGMPLQVDSTFMYVNGKNTYELTLDDLKIDSLYNTYKYKGLPPGPINNPGIEAMVSAMNPVKTKYLYFLTEKDGTIHYASTFEEHKRNKELYLK
ncbi:MAG: hypothetical protein A2566_00730 [Candidatus Zambryskibacteria bacterium RIFOXYD1_FULL_40_13]|nr:MAG: putative periplasmic solute-binding protein [Parcubacteria group bacterium GW2011_GWC1_39_12]KKR19655.1 MAG: putative periplasmic solute-binding protein [Parcubacteria group bacterium GW2011_GWF1_39_37]KKR35811.1 MAG: putative periplasmic solute-binding protein [Parcubacteria group bacterium GW2011_GWC2_40_10]KKR52623.1 MAG: putative periplasmic solute-binding protein [Parcubacteria group bacterium GW2011_GWE1_40_20]KKR65027.1 MAG: putative periplasmic solute-binding protein [Parcubacte